MKIITKNKKALFDYEIQEKLEAGIVLTGDEVKALRAGHVNLTGSYATISQGELVLLNCQISPYSHAFMKKEEEATRTRKLLVHKKELQRIIGSISRKGITVVPLALYFNERNIVKVELGLGKHKKAAGKKQVIKERDIQRETERELRQKY
ncbi:MAG TPA: SsrA-binding protein SmpB [Candidatus Babeliales bacterium]|nr:SsrA-binding protein SmpB [Candidatus Babeliales bacterium]